MTVILNLHKKLKWFSILKASLGTKEHVECQNKKFVHQTPYILGYRTRWEASMDCDMTVSNTRVIPKSIISYFTIIVFIVIVKHIVNYVCARVELNAARRFSGKRNMDTAQHTV